MIERLKKWWRRLTRAYVCGSCRLRCQSRNGLSRHLAKCKERNALGQAAQAIRG